jgi:hypothetical protein
LEDLNNGCKVNFLNKQKDNQSAMGSLREKAVNRPLIKLLSIVFAQDNTVQIEGDEDHQGTVDSQAGN